MSEDMIVSCIIGWYFIPSLMALGRKHNLAIFILNLFLGWTLIGWVGALIWAIIDERKPNFIMIWLEDRIQKNLAIAEARKAEKQKS